MRAAAEAAERDAAEAERRARESGALPPTPEIVAVDVPAQIGRRPSTGLLIPDIPLPQPSFAPQLQPPPPPPSAEMLLPDKYSPSPVIVPPPLLQRQNHRRRLAELQEHENDLEETLSYYERHLHDERPPSLHSSASDFKRDFI